MPRSKRRRPRLDERTTPCWCCGYPISQRHHLLPAARYGETDVTAQLCANCHEAYHIFSEGLLQYYAELGHVTRAYHLTAILIEYMGGLGSAKVTYLLDLIGRVEEAQKDNISSWYMHDNTRLPPIVRRGDWVRLRTGQVTQVIRVSGNSIFTTVGVVSPQDIERVAGDR